MLPTIPAVTIHSEFTLFIPVYAYSDSGTASPVLQSDLTNPDVKIRAHGGSEWITCSATVVAGGITVPFTEEDFPEAGYWDLQATFLVRNVVHRLIFSRAFEITTTSDRCNQGNCATRPSVLSNYGTTDTVLEDRIAALRVELQTANDAKATALASLTQRNIAYNNLATEYNTLLAEYNALIDGGGVKPDVDPSGDDTPIDGAGEWDFDDPDNEMGHSLPTTLWMAMYMRTEIRTIPDFDIKEIKRSYAFQTCTKLKVFANSFIERISGGYTFYGCSQLQTVSLPLLTSISGTQTFDSCSQLQTVSLPLLTSISGSQTFYSCSQLQTVSLPLLTSISGTHTFYGCSQLQTVSLPLLTSISGSYTFYVCSQLRTVSLPRLTSISGQQAFAGCSQLRRLYFPECTSIGGGENNFFGSCTRLGYIFLGHPRNSFSLSTWNPSYWTETVAEKADFIASAQEEYAIQKQGQTVECKTVADALAVLFYVGIIDRLYDLPSLVTDGIPSPTATLTLNATFKTRLAQSSLWAGYVQQANAKGWSIA